MLSFRVWRLTVTAYSFGRSGVMFSWGRRGGWQTVIGHWPPGR